MNRLAVLAKNSLWLLGVRIASQGLVLLFTVLLARSLGSAGFGEYAFFTAFVLVGNVLTTFGTDMLLIREIAARDGLSQLGEAAAVQIALSILFILLTWLGAPALPNQSPASVAALQVYSLALIPLSFYSVFTTALRGKERMDLYALLGLLVAALKLAAVWLFAEMSRNVVSLAGLLLAVDGIIALVAAGMCSQAIPGFWAGWSFSLRKVSRLIKDSAPFGFLGLLGMLYQKLSVTLLSILGGASPVGLFSAAQRGVEAAKTGHLAILTVLYPAMSNAHANPAGAKDWRRALLLACLVLLAGAGLFAFILSWFAGPLIEFFYGPGFSQAIPILRIVAWVLVPYTINQVVGLSFLAAGRERAVVLILPASLLVLTALTVWWTPSAGLAGAAWAVLVAEWFQAILLALQIIRRPAFLSKGVLHELSDFS